MSSRYGIEPIDLNGLRTVSLYERGGKVRISDFARPYTGKLLDCLPKILAGDTIRAVLAAIAAAQDRGKPVLCGMGGQVIKCKIVIEHNPDVTKSTDRVIDSGPDGGEDVCRIVAKKSFTAEALRKVIP